MDQAAEHSTTSAQPEGLLPPPDSLEDGPEAAREPVPGGDGQGVVGGVLGVGGSVPGGPDEIPGDPQLPPGGGVADEGAAPLLPQHLHGAVRPADVDGVVRGRFKKLQFHDK